MLIWRKKERKREGRRKSRGKSLRGAAGVGPLVDRMMKSRAMSSWGGKTEGVAKKRGFGRIGDGR